MSVLPDGRRVYCDGNDCRATAPLPVALRGTLSETPPGADSLSILGWLFAGSPGNVKHFCPRCLPLYLSEALGGSIHPLLGTVFEEEKEKPER